MQATTGLHDGITNTVRQEAPPVFHHAVAFHPTDHVFDATADRGNGTSRGLLLGREFTSPRFFLGLDARHPLTCVALEPQIVIETTATWEGIAFQISQACIIFLPVRRGTQEAKMTGLLDHEETFDGGARLLAAIVVLLVLGIVGALAWSRRTSRPHRGVVDSACDC